MLRFSAAIEGRAIQFCRRLMACGRCFSIAALTELRSPPNSRSPDLPAAETQRGITRVAPAAAVISNKPRRFMYSIFHWFMPISPHSMVSLMYHRLGVARSDGTRIQQCREYDLVP